MKHKLYKKYARIDKVFRDYPILHEYSIKNNPWSLSSDKLNELFGFERYEYQGEITYMMFNDVLDELERQGRI